MYINHEEVKFAYIVPIIELTASTSSYIHATIVEEDVAPSPSAFERFLFRATTSTVAAPTSSTQAVSVPTTGCRSLKYILSR